ncbi:MAG: hypothetical protein K2X98_05050 [Alphaproteobacteria bacterium]|nr:hypothetical protein [Alphaproteobacteria bacterium]
MPTRIGELKNSSQHSFNIKKSDIIEKCLMEFKETITIDLGKAYDFVINDISVKGMVSGAEKTSNKLNIDYSQYAAASTYILTYTAGKLALERQ